MDVVKSIVERSIIGSPESQQGSGASTRLVRSWLNEFGDCFWALAYWMPQCQAVRRGRRSGSCAVGYISRLGNPLELRIDRRLKPATDVHQNTLLIWTSKKLLVSWWAFSFIPCLTLVLISTAPSSIYFSNLLLSDILILLINLAQSSLIIFFSLGCLFDFKIELRRNQRWVTEPSEFSLLFIFCVCLCRVCVFYGPETAKHFRLVYFLIPNTIIFNSR